VSRPWRPSRALTDWLRQRPRAIVALLIWAAFAFLMGAVGVGRVASHRAFGSWVSFVASAVVAGFYAYWLAGRLSYRRARRTSSDSRK
jgi:membrane associated rhomboid family serine protease